MHKTLDDYMIDPELPEECDPEVEDEVFRILEELGTVPESLFDRDFAERYARWRLLAHQRH